MDTMLIFKKYSRYISLFLAMLILCLSLAGCGGSSPEASSENNGELSSAELPSKDGSEVETGSGEESEAVSEPSSDEIQSEAVSELTSDEDGSEAVFESTSDEAESEESSDETQSETASESTSGEAQSEAVSESTSGEAQSEAVSELISEEAPSEESSVEISTEEFSSAWEETSKPDEIVKPKDPKDPITPIPTLEADSIDSYFDKSVFIGYSIMMHFGKYVNQWRMDVDKSIMGNSLFCCGVGMCFTMNKGTSPDKPGNALPSYQGQKYNFEDLPKATGSDTIFVGLMVYSETKRSSVENCVNYATNVSIEGIQSIIDANPDVNVVVLSGTYNTGLYRTEEISPQRANNENVREYNSRVLKYCNENGIDFIDVSTPLLNGYGYMPKEYSSDKDYHISKEPFKIWIHILRDYARAKQNGTWRNISEMPPLVQE